MNADERRYKEISGTVIGAAFDVSNELGVGFLEKVYENALFVELTLRGLKVRQQQPLTCKYKGVVVGDYVADLIVEDCVLIELKHCQNLDKAHHAQCLNYLRATDLKLCLLINFGKPRIDYDRVVHNL